MKCRRISKLCGLVTISIMLGTMAVGQTLTSTLLEDLSRYIGAAARLTANATIGIDKANAAPIPNTALRKEAGEELKGISRALSELRVKQTPLVEDLSEYTKDVRTRGFNHQRHDRSWQEILSIVEVVSRTVQATLSVVERSKWLKVALDENDRVELREVIMTRGILLSRFARIPTPSRPEELEQLDRMNGQYRQLMKSLHALNIALTRATDRLKLD